MLAGTRILLRQPLDEDIDFLVQLRNDPLLQQNLMAVARPNTPQRVRRWLDDRLNNHRTLFFIVARRDDNKAVGYIQLREMDPLHGHGELGICLEESAHGTGAARESLELLGNYARDTFRLRKITLRVLTSNERAIAFYEKTGFRRVGTMQAHYYHQRRFHDVLIMEKMLDDEAGGK